MKRRTKQFLILQSSALSSTHAINLDQPKNLLFDKELNVTQMMEFVVEVIENIVGKGESAGYQYFLLFTLPFCRIAAIGLV